MKGKELRPSEDGRYLIEDARNARGEIYKRRYYIPDRYIVYAYKGAIYVKHGIVEPGGLFIPDNVAANKYPYHTNCHEKPLQIRRCKIWCDKDHIEEAKRMLKDHYKNRIPIVKDIAEVAISNAISIINE